MIPGDPGARMAACVQNGHDDNQVRNQSKNDAIREAVNEGLTEFSGQTCKGERMMGNPCQGFLHAADEVSFQVRVAVAIPFLCLGQISLGNREKYDGVGHVSSRRCLTSSQGDAVMAPVS